MVQFLHAVGVEGASVLESSGGIGEIGVEPLQAGAARAQNLELSPAYQEPARTLAVQAGVQGDRSGQQRGNLSPGLIGELVAADTRSPHIQQRQRPEPTARAVRQALAAAGIGGSRRSGWPHRSTIAP